MDDLTPLLNAIDIAYRMAVKAGETDTAKLLLIASLAVSQRIESPKRKTA
jgi:hypothetical protein